MMTNDSKDQGREAFEANADKRGYNMEKSGEFYTHQDTHERWLGWQAALATSASALARDEASVLTDEVKGVIKACAFRLDEVGSGFLATKLRAQLSGSCEVSVLHPASAELPDPNDIQGWMVTVNVNAQDILTIGHNSLSGIDNIEDFAPVVRNCAEHLLSFIGPAASSAATVSDAASVPPGFALVPVKISDAMIESALAAHYGKRRMDQYGGARGIAMTVNDQDFNGHEFMQRIWKGALAVTDATTTAGAQDERVAFADFRDRCEHYHGFKMEDDESQCTCKGNDHIGSWCEEGDCPIRSRAASSATAPLTSDSDAGERIARALHYPACWDTAAYPTLSSAIAETISAHQIGCSECEARAQSTNGEQS